MRPTQTFNQEVRSELTRVWPEKTCCAIAELRAILRVEGTTPSGEAEWTGVNLRQPAVARKTYRLLRRLGSGAKLKVTAASGLQKKIYRVEFEPQATLLDPALPAERCCLRAYLRGAFLCRGSLSSPEREYHMEIAVDVETTAVAVQEVFRQLELDARISRRKGVHVVYLKEGDKIAEVLSLMGAHAALLKFENLRIIKGMRNRVNRLVNSETANLEKTVHAAMQQLDAIRLIDEAVGLTSLSPPLRQLAQLRIEYPYASLGELGEMTVPRLTKSGVNYRMKRIVQLADEIAQNSAPKSGRKSPRSSE